MLVGNRCLRCIALSLPFPTAASLSTQSRPRPFSTSPNNYDPQSHNYGQNSASSLPQSQHSAPPSDSGNLRMALDSLADAVLMLSHITSQWTAERQLLLNRKSGLFQKYKRTVEKEKKQVLLSEVNSVNASIKAVEYKLLYARESQIPVSYYVRLKRLHGNLPYPKPRRPNRKDDQSTLIRRSHSTLIGLLSLPGSNVLHELAHFLVTTSLPITETSFLVIIQKLSVLRFGSAARSAYHSLITAGYSPTSPRAISLMLKLMPAIRERREFHRLQTLLQLSNISHDPYIYTQLIVGDLKMGSPTRALQQFRAMIASRFQPTLQALTALLHDCGSRRNWHLGIEVWRSLCLGQTNLRFRIDLWAYQEMWRLCRKCGEQIPARQILRAAKKEGFKVDDLIHTRGRKTKSLAIRATNKAPQLRDLRNSLKEPPLKIDDFTREAIRNAVSTPSRSRQTPRPPESSLKSSSTLSEIPSSQYRQAVEKMMLAKYRKSSPTISSSWMEESNIAIPLSHDRRSPTYCQHGDWDEHLSDIVREAAETFLSGWSVLSTTKGQTLKSRLWFKYAQTSPRPELPPPTPLDLAKHLNRSHQSSNQHPRSFLTLSKAHKKPLATSRVGRVEATDKTTMVYTAAWTGASRCRARGKKDQKVVSSKVDIN